MSEALTAQERGWFHAPDFAWIVTLNPDGSPQASLTWIDAALAEIDDGKGRLYDEAAVAACVKLFRENRFRFA
jgi:predicted pyridoxine 5'-phosphate oxidase superfamily flavin-nucleotide-binding protein